LRALLRGGGARNALDCALWDLAAKHSGHPAWKLAGLAPPRSLLTTFTLGVDEPPQMAEQARALPEARALKLKLTGSPALEAERVRRVREARPDVWLGVDANQGLGREGLEALMPMLLTCGVRLIEQPVRRGAEAELEGFRSPIPLAADESAIDLADLPTLVGRFQVVNIKLDKCGGLTEGFLMAAEARRLGLSVMVGNMMGSSLAMAPALLLGQQCDVVDLDGPTFLAVDREPAVDYADGSVSYPWRDGWGAAA
jgi:L-alanine-DL-glutamate epimerase-like enolase superfamily enzyme